LAYDFTGQNRLKVLVPARSVAMAVICNIQPLHMDELVSAELEVKFTTLSEDGLCNDDEALDSLSESEDEGMDEVDDKETQVQGLEEPALGEYSDDEETQPTIEEMMEFTYGSSNGE
jgi:hypothetical protein